MTKNEMREAGLLEPKVIKKENNDNTYIVYQPWVLGYDRNEECTGFEFCFGEYETAEEALNRMEEVSVKDIDIKIPRDVKYLCWQVETVKVYEDRNFEENIETISESWTDRKGN